MYQLQYPMTAIWNQYESIDADEKLLFRITLLRLRPPNFVNDYYEKR